MSGQTDESKSAKSDMNEPDTERELADDELNAVAGGEPRAPSWRPRAGLPLVCCFQPYRRFATAVFESVNGLSSRACRALA